MKLSKREKIILLLFFSLYISALYMGYVYPWGGWNAGDEVIERSEFINSYLGNVKVLLSVIILLLIAKHELSKLVVFLIMLMGLLAGIEGSRTQFFFLITTVLILMFSKITYSKKNIIYSISVIFSLCIFMAFIALYRLGININSDFDYINLLYPFYMEGMYGSYMCLQIYDLTWLAGKLDYTYGVHLFIDPIIYLIPRVFFLFLGLNKDAFTMYSNWSIEAGSFLDDPLGPFGGFYFIGDAFLAFSFLGPPLLSGFYGYLLGRFRNYPSLGIRNRYFYSIFLMGFLMPFIKHQIAQSTHFFMVTFIFGAIIYSISGYRKVDN